jgi:TolB-like protein
MSLIAELKRRKVFKVGAAYLVVAWIAVQGASIGFPAFDAPPWVLRVFILIALLGFPVAVVMAWVFDITPDGVKLDTSTSGSKRMFMVAGLLGVLAVGWYFYGQPSFRKGDAATPASLTASDPHSIAVLPFDNMSGDPKQDYFSDGMTEQLLDVLAKVQGLKVVARTSVFQFKGKGGDVRDIGRKLGVAYIVEGSVRRDGQEVRITAQLVRVSDGFHVWSETYDRKLESVFALQDEIAGRIGATLKQSLGVSAAITARTPVDPVAYDEYLKGRALLRARKDLPSAIDHFEAAVAKAPEFAEGWSSLSLAEDTIYWYVSMDQQQARDWLTKAAAAAAEAQKLAPDSAATEHVLANVARERFDYAEAERHYMRSIALDPSYPDAREDYSELMYLVGRPEDSLRATNQLVQLDPYFIVGWMRRMSAATALDDRADVESSLRRLRILDPNFADAKFGALNYALAYGRSDEVRKAVADIQARYPDDGKLLQDLMPWAQGEANADEQAARAALKALPSTVTATFLVARGDAAEYVDYSGKAGPMTQTYFFANAYSKQHSAGLSILRDPMVKVKLVEYGFVRYWREKGWPAGCRPLHDTNFECGLDAAK